VTEPVRGTLGATDSGRPAHDVPGVRVVLDARPLQEPDRAPLTAAYLGGLLGAFDAAPLEGESFALLLQSDLDDPTERFAGLTVVGRRLLPPTRHLRSGALTVDPFLLTGASLGAAWRAECGGAAGSVYHAVGGSIPLASGLPLVVTLLDLAPWELPDAYQSGTTWIRSRRIRSRRRAIVATASVPTMTAAASRSSRPRRRWPKRATVPLW